MTYNFHAHTHRCHHARGTEEEYVLRAIEGGIRVMGFSEHFPFKFPDGHQSSYRLLVEEVTDYCHEIHRLKEKYRDKIELHIGFEMEYYPEHLEAMLKSARNYGAEYLILGPHFLSPEHEYPRGVSSYGNATESIAELHDYASLLTEALHKNVFTYIAHPDIFYFTGDKEAYRQEMSRICAAARECNTPLEINFLGIREQRFYPRNEFWEIAGIEQCPVTFGFDAHSANSACDLGSLETAKELIKKYHLRYIGMPALKPLTDAKI